MICMGLLMTAAAYTFFWVAGAYSFFVSCITTFAFNTGLRAILRRRISLWRVFSSVLLMQQWSLDDEEESSKGTNVGSFLGSGSSGGDRNPNPDGQPAQPGPSGSSPIPSLSHMDMEMASRRMVFHQGQQKETAAVHPIEAPTDSELSPKATAAGGELERKPTVKLQLQHIDMADPQARGQPSPGRPRRSRGSSSDALSLEELHSEHPSEARPSRGSLDSMAMTRGLDHPVGIVVSPGDPIGIVVAPSEPGDGGGGGAGGNMGVGDFDVAKKQYIQLAATVRDAGTLSHSLTHLTATVLNLNAVRRP